MYDLLGDPTPRSLDEPSPIEGVLRQRQVLAVQAVLTFTLRFDYFVWATGTRHAGVVPVRVLLDVPRPADRLDVE